MRRTWRPAAGRQAATEREVGMLPGGEEVAIFSFVDSHSKPIDLQGRLCTSLHMSRADGPWRRNSCITPSQSTEKESTASPARRQHPRGCNFLSHWPPVFNHLVLKTKQSRISSLLRLQARPASLRSYFSSFFHLCSFLIVVLFTCSLLILVIFSIIQRFFSFFKSQIFSTNSWTFMAKLVNFYCETGELFLNQGTFVELKKHF